MSRPALPAPLSPDVAPSHDAPLGPPPLVMGENLADFQQLEAQVAAAEPPSDLIDRILLDDYTNLEWEILRLRRIKAAVITGALRKALARVLRPLLKDEKAATMIAEKWAERDSNIIIQVQDLLASASLSMDDVYAEALTVKLTDVERIDRLIAAAEARRNNSLDERERHRAARARRRNTGTVEDGQFEEVALQPQDVSQ